MRWHALLILIGLSAPLAAQDAIQPRSAVQVRQSADPATGIVIGQHVALYVDVLFPGEMIHPPRVKLPDVPGLQIFRFETQGVTMRETIGSEPYVGQRFEFAAYPRRGGAFDLAPAAITLLDRDGGEAGSAQGQPVHLDVTVPPGVDASQPVVATRRLSLSEQWDPQPTGRFKAGDAMVRTIIRTAEDVPGLAMRDLAFPAPDGVRVYADPPDIDDHSNRGVVTGSRTDRVTYVFERGGHIELPAVTQPWWDLGAARLNVATAPAVTVNVEPATASAPSSERRFWTLRGLLWPALGFALLIALAMALWCLLRHLRMRRADPEHAAFAALRGACSGADAREIYRRFTVWSACLTPQQRQMAQREAAALQVALFATHPGSWRPDDSRRLLAGLDSLRQQHPNPGARPALPPLNPDTPVLAGSGERAS